MILNIFINKKESEIYFKSISDSLTLKCYKRKSIFIIQNKFYLLFLINFYYFLDIKPYKCFISLHIQHAIILSPKVLVLSCLG